MLDQNKFKTSARKILPLPNPGDQNIEIFVELTSRFHAVVYKFCEIAYPLACRQCLLSFPWRHDEVKQIKVIFPVKTIILLMGVHNSRF